MHPGARQAPGEEEDYPGSERGQSPLHHETSANTPGVCAQMEVISSVRQLIVLAGGVNIDQSQRH